MIVQQKLTMRAHAVVSGILVVALGVALGGLSHAASQRSEPRARAGQLLARFEARREAILKGPARATVLEGGAAAIVEGTVGVAHAAVQGTHQLRLVGGFAIGPLAVGAKLGVTRFTGPRGAARAIPRKITESLGGFIFGLGATTGEGREDDRAVADGKGFSSRSAHAYVGLPMSTGDDWGSEHEPAPTVDVDRAGIPLTPRWRGSALRAADAGIGKSRRALDLIDRGDPGSLRAAEKILAGLEQKVGPTDLR